MIRHSQLTVLSVVALYLACAFPNFAQDQYPRYNQVYGIATHNSYWINRSDQVDYFASGTQELLTDQLLHDHVRALEIDVHSEGAPAGRWKVYHTSDSEDFLCRYLEDCLEMVRNFHYALPDHDVVNLIIELKNTVARTGVASYTTPAHDNFAADHTIQQFDDTFRRLLGPWLYTPHDFLGRCAAGTTMVECARSSGWPRIDELRGKFIINVIGNWSSAGADWVRYATSGVSDRVAFPIQSVFSVTQGPCANPTGRKQLRGVAYAEVDFTLTLDGLTACIRDIDSSLDESDTIDLGLRRSAFDASVFWQLEDLGPLALERAQAFLARGGVIRGHDAFETDKQRDQLLRGIQMIQTDYPWHVVNDDGPTEAGLPTDPSHRLRDSIWANPRLGIVSGRIGAYQAPFAPYREPGGRLYAHSAFPAQVWAYETVPSISERWWETTVSTTRRGDTWTTNTHDGLILDDVPLNYARRAQEFGEGAIRVESEDGQDSVKLGRQKNTTPGASYFQESVDLYISVRSGGKQMPERQLRAARYGPCKRDEDPNSADVSRICVGSLIAMSVKNSDGASVVKAFSAGRMGIDGKPAWQELGTWTFLRPLTRQGFNAFGDVLFAGPRRAIALNSSGMPDGPYLTVPLTSLPGRQFSSSSQDQARIVDLSYFPPRTSITTTIVPKEVTIAANRLWVDTDIVLAQGQRFRIAASGQWSNTGPPSLGPDGFKGYLYPGTVLPSASLGSLIGKVGQMMFSVGSNFDGSSPDSGKLYLSINDTPTSFADNQGALSVKIFVF